MCVALLHFRGLIRVSKYSKFINARKRVTNKNLTLLIIVYRYETHYIVASPILAINAAAFIVYDIDKYIDFAIIYATA